MTDRQLPADHAAHGRGPRRAPVPFSHIGLTVPDLDAATRWYVDVLGWELLMGPIDVSTDNPRQPASFEMFSARTESHFAKLTCTFARA